MDKNKLQMLHPRLFLNLLCAFLLYCSCNSEEARIEKTIRQYWDDYAFSNNASIEYYKLSNLRIVNISQYDYDLILLDSQSKLVNSYQNVINGLQNRNIDRDAAEILIYQAREKYDSLYANVQLKRTNINDKYIKISYTIKTTIKNINTDERKNIIEEYEQILSRDSLKVIWP